MTSPDILVRAAVSDGRGHTGVEDRRLPHGVSRLRVESSAVCGTDVMLHDHGLRRPAVLGHHTIGRVEHLTPDDAVALGIEVGTRVAVEEYVGCGTARSVAPAATGCARRWTCGAAANGSA